jgi:hypothetical protein
MTTSSFQNYYVANAKQITKEVKFALPHFQRILVKMYGEETAKSVVSETMERFQALLPELPYIGGKENRLTENLYLTAAMLAFYRVLSERGKPIDEIARILYLGSESLYSSFPFSLMLRLGGLTMFSRKRLEQAKREAAASHERKYPGDWVKDVVEGDGKTFLFGTDYLECGIVKYLNAQGAPELAPYLCWLDYPMMKVMRVGLVRTETIAQGCERCNFRFCRWEDRQEITPDFLKKK